MFTPVSGKYASGDDRAVSELVQIAKDIKSLLGVNMPFEHLNPHHARPRPPQTPAALFKRLNRQ